MTGYQDTADAVRRAIDAEPELVRGVAAVVRVAAADGAEAWTSLAADLDRALHLADRHQRWALLKAKAKCEQLGKLSGKLQADLDRALGEVSR